MTDLIKKLKIPIIVAAGCLVLFVGYNFFKGPASSSGNIVGTAEENAVPQEEQQFLNLLLKIQGITIDTAIFSDPVFKSLQDDGLEIPDQPHGRRNPFAPIGTGGNIDATSTPI